MLLLYQLENYLTVLGFELLHAYIVVRNLRQTRSTSFVSNGLQLFLRRSAATLKEVLLLPLLLMLSKGRVG